MLNNLAPSIVGATAVVLCLTAAFPVLRTPVATTRPSAAWPFPAAKGLLPSRVGVGIYALRQFVELLNL